MTTRTTGVIRVAVVDDQPLLVSAFSALVAAQPDMEVVLEAVNGRQAINGLTTRASGSRGEADLVLMDLRMPVMDGLTATQEIRLHEATMGLDRTPIVMLTANAMPEHVAAGRAAGADHHLAKPFNAAELLSLVESPQALLAQHRIAA